MLKDGVRVMRPTSPTQTGPPRGAKAAKQGKKPSQATSHRSHRRLQSRRRRQRLRACSRRSGRQRPAAAAASKGGARCNGGPRRQRSGRRAASAASPPYETGEAKQCDSRGKMQCNRSVCANTSTSTSTSTSTVTIPAIGKPAAPKLILRTPDPHFLSRVLGQVERLTFQRGWSSLETLRLARQNPQSSLMENVAAAVAAETKAKERSDALKKNQNALCKECGNDNRADFGPTVDGDAMVCNRCGVVASGIFKSLHRDRNCTEDEDKTVRAERHARRRRIASARTRRRRRSASRARTRIARYVPLARGEGEAGTRGRPSSSRARRRRPSATASRCRQRIRPRSCRSSRSWTTSLRRSSPWNRA